MSNQKFPKVMVLDPVAKYMTTGGIKPHQLGDKEVGAFHITSYGVIGNNIGATPTAANSPRIQIHQNIGDNKYGTVRTQPIDVNEVIEYYGQSAKAAQTEIWHLGYDGVNAAKDIVVTKNETLQFSNIIWNKELAKWYDQNPGYRKTISVYTGAGTGAADKDVVADAIVAAYNNTNQPEGDFETGTELELFVTATKVTTGTPGQADYRVGVKLETKPVAPQKVSSHDAVSFTETELTTLSVIQLKPINGSVYSVVPVTKSQAGETGSGFPAQLEALEKESQMYDRVREVFYDNRYMKLANFINLAKDGAKYDFLFISYNYTHNTGAAGAAPRTITEPYTLIIAAPTGTLQPVANIFNAWLAARFPAVTL